MGRCNHCGTFILFGGKRLGDRRFCSDRCFAQGSSLVAAHQLAQQVPEELIQKQIAGRASRHLSEMRRDGPVDVHTSHRVWSAIHVTSWKSRPQVCCRDCGVKAKFGDALFSFCLGWWGFPFGLVLTPIQIGRNLVGIFHVPDPTKPSPYLQNIVRMDIANRAVRIQAEEKREALDLSRPNMMHQD